MDTVEVKTSELIGAALDWAVAQAEGVSIRILSKDNIEEKWQIQMRWRFQGPFWPSQDWRQCGPLIEKYNIGFGLYDDCILAITGHNEFAGSAYGSTHLIAACRSIVAAKLGDTVSIPSELMQ